MAPERAAGSRAMLRAPLGVWTEGPLSGLEVHQTSDQKRQEIVGLLGRHQQELSANASMESGNPVLVARR